MSSSTKDSLQFQDVFARLSVHLDKLAGQVYDVEEALGGIWSETGAKNGMTVTKLQSLDFVRQSLEDCALLVHYLSLECDVDTLSHSAVSEFSQRLKLNTTKGIVAGSSQELGMQRGVEPGQIDLF